MEFTSIVFQSLDNLIQGITAVQDVAAIEAALTRLIRPCAHPQRQKTFLVRESRGTNGRTLQGKLSRSESSRSQPQRWQNRSYDIQRGAFTYADNILLCDQPYLLDRPNLDCSLDSITIKLNRQKHFTYRYSHEYSRILILSVFAEIPLMPPVTSGSICILGFSYTYTCIPNTFQGIVFVPPWHGICLYAWPFIHRHAIVISFHGLICAK